LWFVLPPTSQCRGHFHCGGDLVCASIASEDQAAFLLEAYVICSVAVVNIGDIAAPIRIAIVLRMKWFLLDT
jgi:hypothetical protein